MSDARLIYLALYIRSLKILPQIFDVPETPGRPAESKRLTALPLLNHLPDPSGEEYLSGKFYLCSLPSVSAFDFDEGKVTDADNRESDIQLEIGKATFDNHIIYYINDVNDSFVDEIEPQSPTYSECKELVSSPTRLGYVLGIPSNSGCIQTDKGRLGYFRILEINPIGDESIEFFFVIWNKKD